jgi:hypothetical protein
MPRPNRWFVLRLAIIGFFACKGLFFPQPDEPIPWLIVPFAFFGFFFGLFIQAWIAISRGGTRYVWRRPSWYANPFINLFRNTQPLQFFHMGAFCFMALGLVSLVFGSWDWQHGAPLALFPFSGGFGVWMFVRVFCLIFGKRMDESNKSLQATAAAPASCD